jgi:hypothetical protein
VSKQSLALVHAEPLPQKLFSPLRERGDFDMLRYPTRDHAAFLAQVNLALAGSRRVLALWKSVDDKRDLPVDLAELTSGNREPRGFRRELVMVVYAGLSAIVTVIIGSKVAQAVETQNWPPFVAAYLTTGLFVEIPIAAPPPPPAALAPAPQIDPAFLDRFREVEGRNLFPKDFVAHSYSNYLVRPRRGAILWNMPERMRVSLRERVEVRIGDTDLAEDQLREGLRGRGVPQIDRLEITPLMRVQLVASENDFLVKSLSTMDHLIRHDNAAKWDFDVVPIRSGSRVLRVLVSMRVKVESNEEIVDLPSYEREVHVAVAPLHSTGAFIGRNWQWIATAIVVPLAAWGLAHTDLGTAVSREFGLHP